MTLKYKSRLELIYEDIRENPNDPALWHHAAVTHRAAREIQKAVDAGHRAIDLALANPEWRIEKFSWTRFIIAICLFVDNKINAAEEECYVALKENPRNPDFYFLLTKIFHGRQDYPKVIEYGKQYLTLRDELVGRIYGVDSHYDTLDLHPYIHSMVQDALVRLGGFDSLLMEIANAPLPNKIVSEENAGESQG
jgi:tetratricopeptide (TPR) repeat protein